MPSLPQQSSAKASETAIVSSDPARVAGSDAAKPMAKTTNLNVDIAATACRNYSLIMLVKPTASNLQPPRPLYGYDESRFVGPHSKTRW